MYLNIFKLSFIVLFFGIFSMPASAQYTPKDSYHFMKDDGIFSEEEKDLEAEYIKKQCETSALEREYYDCSCIAGAYRIERNSEKLEPQDSILYRLYNDRESKCADPVKTAGNVFKFCKNYADFFQPDARDNQGYCECVANKVATDFSREPRLKSKFINNLKLKAMSSCRNNIPAISPQ